MELDIDFRLAIILLFTSFLAVFYLHKGVLTMDIQGAHAWRQCQTMWNVRNFVRHDANILNPRVSFFNGGKENIQRYEFPLLQYSISLVFKVFGESVFLMRFLLFLLAVATSFGFFYLVRDLFDHNLTALTATCLFQLSPIFYYYSWNPLPDNLALFGAIFYLFFILRYQRKGKFVHLILASLSLLIATLAKLPFLMFASLSIFFWVQSIFSKKPLKHILTYSGVQILIILPAFIWYAWVMPSWTGNSVLFGIFKDQLPLREYKFILEFYAKDLIPLQILYATVWIFALLGIVSFWKRNLIGKYWLLSLVLVTFLYLVLELNAINTIHDYYMLPFLPWIYLCVGSGVFLCFKSRYQMIRFLPIIAILWAPFDSVPSAEEKWTMAHDGFNPDVYKYKEDLKSVLPNESLCIIFNDRSQSIFSYNIDKMGHIFWEDELPVQWIEDMIDNYGITHVYSDSRKVDQNYIFQESVDSLIMQRGSINVYKLRDPKSDTIKFMPEFKRK